MQLVFKRKIKKKKSRKQKCDPSHLDEYVSYEWMFQHDKNAFSPSHTRLSLK